MQNDIRKIIDDLCKIDPSFRAHEKELRSLVSEILKAKPDARYDERFKEELRNKIHMAIEEKKAVAAPKKAAAFRPWIFATATAGVGILALVLMLASPDAPLTPSTGSAIAVLAPGAFGELAGTTVVKDGSLGSPTAISARPQAAIGLGGGGGGRGMAVGEMSADAKMMPPQEWHPVYVKYAYAGDPLQLDGQAVDVFRRARYARPAAPAALMGATGLPLDLSKFGGRLDNYSLTEDKEFGYSIFVNTVEGSVSIGQNWQRWPHPESACFDEACFSALRLTPEAIPSDEEIIGIADRFLDEYGIDRSAYGRPSVQDEWRIAYEKTEDKRFAYVPESISLVYPQLVEGVPAYDEGGNAAGLYVSVSARHKRVDNLAGIAGRSFERSSYPAVASADELLRIVERGGVYGPVSYEDGAEVIEATVGTPEKVLLRVYAPSTDGYSQELFVPALRFPVTSAPSRDDIYVPKAIVVPLAESLAKPPMQPQPMPYLMTK